MNYQLNDIKSRYKALFPNSAHRTSERLDMFLFQENALLVECRTSVSSEEKHELNQAQTAIMNMRMHLRVGKKKDFVDMLLDKFELDLNSSQHPLDARFRNPAYGVLIRMDDFFMKMLEPNGPYLNPRIKKNAPKHILFGR